MLTSSEVHIGIEKAKLRLNFEGNKILDEFIGECSNIQEEDLLAVIEIKADELLSEYSSESVLSSNIQKKLEESKLLLSKTGRQLLDECISQCVGMTDEDLCSIVDIKVEELLEDYPIPTIRFIKFEDLVAFGSFPRYPDNKELAVDIETIDRDNSLLIFLSHCWMRGHKDTEGWDGKHHPDNVNGDKFTLSTFGIRELKIRYAPRMKDCYVWLDYGCMDQDNKCRLTDELERYDKVMECCDLMFTPIVDKEHMNWNLTITLDNQYDSYKAKLWNGGPDAYLNRGWCRIEMLYAAHIPVLPNTNNVERWTMFESGLANHCIKNRRPHFLFGTKECESRIDGILLPSLNNSFLINYHPLQGNLSVPSDIQNIELLIAELQPYIDRNKTQSGYRGELNEKGQRHGYGINYFDDGSIYDGNWMNNEASGFGVLESIDGGRYEGQWVGGTQHGEGTQRFSNGNFYVGSFENGNRRGNGRETEPDGTIYEGEFFDDKKHGRGKYTISNGDQYEGDVVESRIEGFGVMQYSNGVVYCGQFNDFHRHGYGVLTEPNGNVYEGEWQLGVRCGNGKQIIGCNGDYDEGEWENDMLNGYGTVHKTDRFTYFGYLKDNWKHGRGKQTSSDGYCYEGDYVDNKCHGQGVVVYPHGSRYEGEFVCGEMEGFGIYTDRDDSYVGHFKNGEFHGQGTWTEGDGSEYDGEWFEGKKHGFGISTGKKESYEGEWKFGKRHGYGKISYPDGRTYQGNWENNVLHI